MMYKDKTEKELRELFKIQENLTFESKLRLRDEINSRALDLDLSELNNFINKKEFEVESLKYLKRAGFRITSDDGFINIYRTTEAKILDLFAFLLGIILCFIGLAGILELFSFFVNDIDFEIATFIYYGSKIALGIIGIGFLNGIKRLINYSGFEVSKIKGLIILSKRVDVKLTKIQLDKSFLSLNEDENQLVLKLDNYDIMSVSNDNMIQKMTLNYLFRALMS